jgi:pimeloyl-ACP methyl ester carboxylesterase
MALPRINIYGVSYGTRWALEVMRRYPNLVRAAVLDGVYPPQVNGEQNEPEIVRRAFEQLYTDCANDTLCRERHPNLRGNVESAIEAAQGKPLELKLQLEDGPQAVKLDGPKLLMVLLHMMREGEAALIPETVAAVQRDDLRLLKMFAEDLESNDGGLLEQNAQQFDGLYNSIECRETWAAVDRAARRKQIEASGVYGLTAKTSKSPAFCPVWRVRRRRPRAPAGQGRDADAALERHLRLADAAGVGPRGRPASRVIAPRRVPRPGPRRGRPGSVRGRLRDAFIEDPEPKRALPCRADTPPNFTAAYERARNLLVVICGPRAVRFALCQGLLRGHGTT